MELITTLVLCSLGLFLFYKYLTTDSRKSKPPGPKALPIVGSAFDIDIATFHVQAYEYAKQYGEICEIKAFNTNVLLLNSVDMVNKAFCDDEYKHIFNDRPPTVVGRYVLLDESIVVSPAGKRHAELRKAFTKGLHIYGDGIARFENIMKDEISRMMAEIDKCEGREFEMVELAKRSLANVISILVSTCYTDGQKKWPFLFDVRFFGIAQDEGDYWFMPVPNTLVMNCPSLRFCPPFRAKFEKFMRARQKSLDKMFHKVKATRNPGVIRGLVDFLLEEQEKEIAEGKEPILTDEVIQVIVIESFSAGIATTASALPSAMLFLINHPDYQTKIQDELDRVLGSDREPSVQDKYEHHLDLLEAVVMETLRLAPPTPLGLPHECTQDVELKEFHIKKYTQVI